MTAATAPSETDQPSASYEATPPRSVTTPHRYYPTDLLLALESVAERTERGELGQLLTQLAAAGVTAPERILEPDWLAEGLDQLFGGISQYPWQPLTDRNDVVELRAVGAIILTDAPEPTHAPGTPDPNEPSTAGATGSAQGPEGLGDASTVLLGLLLGWSTGNSVTIRTDRPEPWRALLDVLGDTGVPLPPARVTDHASPADGRPVTVPALAVGAVLSLECQASWVHQLFTRVHLPGVSLTAARVRDQDAHSERVGARLRYLVGRARRAPYYRDLPVVDGASSLELLPVLEKSALEAHSLPASRQLSSGESPTGEVLRSGATSGQPRYIVYSRTDWENMAREAVHVFYQMGVEPGDRIINTLFGGGMYGGLTTTFSEFSRMPVEAYSSGQMVTVEDILLLTDRFSANVILGMPALIMPMLREAKSREPGLRVPKVLYGGTSMTETDKNWLRSELGTQVVTSVLAANDGAQLGYQCASLGGTLHHINDDYNLIEVVDEALTPVPDGVTGELLVTTLQKFETPLIRYRIGDMGRVLHHDCPCGLSGRVLEYLGRADGLVRARGETVMYGEVLDALEQFGVSQLQIVVDSVDGSEVVTVRTEASEPLRPQLLHDHLTTCFPVWGEFQDFDAGRTAFRLEVECHEQGQLERHPVSGKIRPVEDRRLVGRS